MEPTWIDGPPEWGDPEYEGAMKDQQLADRVVALGVGWYDEVENLYWLQTDDVDAFLDPQVRNNWFKKRAEGFVRDWRVAGALMEKMPPGEIAKKIARDGSCEWLKDPRAIITACVEALEK